MSTKKTAAGFTAQERAAMREHAKELKAERAGQEARQAVLDKIAEMSEEDRALAERVHRVVTTTAPQLRPRTWYGMPAYADRGGKLVCFFRPAAKFGERYATLGFEGAAALDEGSMWPTAFALTGMTPETEARVVELVRRAAGGPESSQDGGTGDVRTGERR